MTLHLGDWYRVYTAAGLHVGTGQISNLTLTPDGALAALAVRLSDGAGRLVPAMYVPSDCTVVTHS